MLTRAVWFRSEELEWGGDLCAKARKRWGREGDMQKSGWRALQAEWATRAVSWGRPARCVPETTGSQGVGGVWVKGRGVVWGDRSDGDRMVKSPADSYMGISLFLFYVFIYFYIFFIFVIDIVSDVPIPPLLGPPLPSPTPLPSGHHHTVVCVLGFCIYVL